MGYSAEQMRLFDQNITWTIPDPVPLDVYKSIGDQVAEGLGAFGVPPLATSVGDWTGVVDIPSGEFIPHMRARHILAWNQPDSGMPRVVNGKIVDYGNCGAPPAIDRTGAKVLSGISAGVGMGVGAAGALVAAEGGALAASAAGLGLLNAVPLVGSIAALALLPFAVIFAHHQAAVANEQKTICSAAADFNQWIDEVDAQVESGGITPEEGLNYVHQLSDQFQKAVLGITRPCTPGNTNAACDVKGQMTANVMLRQWMYVNLPQYNGQGLLSAGGGGLSGVSPIVLLIIAAALFFL